MAGQGRHLPLFVRERDHLKVLDFDAITDRTLKEDPPQDPMPLPTPKVAVWSPTGGEVAVVDSAQGVQILKVGEDGAAPELQTLSGSSKTAQNVYWSPRASHLVTISPATKGSQDPNVQVWQRVTGGDEEWINSASFYYGKLEREKKVLQWTNEESLCGRVCPDGQIHLLDGANLAGAPLLALLFDHPAQSFEFAPMTPNGDFKARLAAFVPDQRDDMQRVVGAAEVTIWDLTAPAGGQLQEQKLTSSSVEAGQLADLQWSHTGSALLAHCQTEVDESGQSYYGGSRLMLISSDGRLHRDLTDGEEAATRLGGNSKGTSVQAVAWSPTRDEFILIQGFQPAQTSLWAWDERAGTVSMAKVLLEKAHRNTIRFNSFGSLVCLAGFGNLAGQIDFFGRPSADRCDYQRVSSCQANCTVASEWAPDGRHFMTAVLAPRMRVDNAVTIWRALDGEKVCGEEYEELYDAQWRPEPQESERFAEVPLEEVDQAAKTQATSSTAEAALPKKQAYRPPRARGGEDSGGATVAAMMRGELAAPEEDRRRKPKQSIATKEREEFKQEKEQRQRATEEEPPYSQPPQQQQQQQNSRPPPPSQAVPPQPSMQQHQQQQRQQQQQQHAAEQASMGRYGQQQQQHQQHPQHQQYGQHQQHQMHHQQQQHSQHHQQHQQHSQHQMHHQQHQQQHPQHQYQQHQSMAAHQQHREYQGGPGGGGYGGGYGHGQGHDARQGHGGHGQGGHDLPRGGQGGMMGGRVDPLGAAHGYPGAAPKDRFANLGADRNYGLGPQSVNQGPHSHGEKLPCPATGWQYVDPKKNIQGPFTLVEMQQWNSMGYFKPDLPMRWDPNDPFVPFAELFPHPLIPFQSYPKRRGQKR